MKCLLDTNLISQSTKVMPDPRISRWFDDMLWENTYLSVISLQEIQTGIDLLADGPKRRGLELWFAEKVLAGFAGRIYGIDASVAIECGHLLASARKASYTSYLGDVLIAATARVHGLPLATLNQKHFAQLGVQLVEF